MNNIEDLPFVQERLALIGSVKPNDQKRQSDRTSKVVYRWQDAKTELQKARLESLRYLEVSRNKTGELIFSVVDESGFADNQSRIMALRELIAKLEDVITELAELNAWYEDVAHQIDQNDTQRIVMNRRISELQALYSLKYPGLSLESIRDTPDFIKKYSEFDQYITNSIKSDERLKPLKAQMQALLESVKC